MKRLMVAMIALTALGALAQQMSLSEARAKIGDAIENASVMTSTIKQLSAADQRQFLADVNDAISKMPGSADTKSAAFLSANRAALMAAQKGSLSDMLAEVFATASLESLTVINESLASDLFNRAADPSVKYSDEQFEKLSKDAVAKIAERNSKADDGVVRTGFAILMFVRASNGSPVNLVDTLSAYLPEDVRETARKDWFPTALAVGEDKSYESMLGTTDAGTLPNERIVLRITEAMDHEVLLVDLAAGNVDNTASLMGAPFGVDRTEIGAGLDNGLYRVAFETEKKVVPVRPEPMPYPSQNLSGTWSRGSSGISPWNPSGRSSGNCCCVCPCVCPKNSAGRSAK